MPRDLFAELDAGQNSGRDLFQELGVEPPQKKERTWGEAVTDTAIDAAKGVVGLGESVVGLTDLATGNLSGKGWAELGYDPKRTKDILSDGYSDVRKEANRNVAEAKGFVDTTKALIQNPSSAAGAIVESAPMTIGGAAVVRSAATRMLAAEGLTAGSTKAAEFLARPDVIAKLTAIGAAAEGAQTTGSIQEQGRQEGREYSQTVAPALAGGALTSIIGVLSSKVPGFKDAEVGAAIAGMGSKPRQTLLAAGKEIAKGTFKEGVLEELPQSAQEQVFTNLALGKPWDEGVAEAAAQGMVAGAGMGGGMNTYTAGRNALAKTLQANPASNAEIPAAQPAKNTESPTVSPPVESASRQNSSQSETQATLSSTDGDQSPPPNQVATTADPLSRLAELELEAGRRDLTPVELAEAQTLITQLQEEDDANQSLHDLEPRGTEGAAAQLPVDVLAGREELQGQEASAPEVGDAAQPQALAQEAPETDAAQTGVQPAAASAKPVASPALQTPAQQITTSALQQTPATLPMPQLSPQHAARVEQIDGRLAAIAADHSNRTPAVQASLEREASRLQSEKTEISQQAQQAQQPQAKAAGPRQDPIMKRDDLVGAIMRVTGGRGIAASMAQTVTGDTANRVSKLRGLFAKDGVQDLDDTATLLRDEEGYDVRDGEHLSELLREAAAGNVAISMERTEREADEHAARQHREAIRERARELGVKTVARRFDDIERDVIAAEQKANADEAEQERLAIQAEALASEVSDETINELLQMAAAENDGRVINGEWITDEQILGAVEPIGEGEEESAAAGLGETAAREAPGDHSERGGQARPRQGRSGRGRNRQVREGGEASRQGNGAPALTLTGQTNEEAAAEFTLQQQGEPELTKDQIDREASGFSLQQQSQASPKQAPTGGQGGLFTVDGRASSTAIIGTESRAIGATREFASAPDGTIDFGEITEAQAKTMRRQAGKIRLEKGDGSYGLQHIEERHGAQIRALGFDSVEAFVADAVGHIETIWQPKKTSQLVMLQAAEKGRAVFIELTPSEDGDFYTVNTAFPVGKFYAQNKGWRLLWGGASVPTEASGANPLAEPSPNAGATATMTPGQSSDSSIASNNDQSNAGKQSLAIPETRFSGFQKMRRDMVQGTLDKFSRQFEGAAALDIRVVFSREEIPERYRPSPYAEGVYHDAEGIIYLVAKNLPTRLRTWQVMMHETVGHYGLASLMGERFSGLWQTVLEQASAGRELDHDPAPGEKDYETVEAVRRLYPDADDNEIAQEVLARMAETMKAPGWVRSVLAQVRQWLKSVAESFGLKIEPTLQDARDLVVMASEHLRRGDNLERLPTSGNAAFASKGSAAPLGQPQSLADVRKQWSRDGIDSFVNERDGTITLSKIVVPDSERESGKGTAAMQSLIDYADRTGQRVVLTPSPDFGGAKNRLVAFYKRFGFVENKGRNKDFTTMEGMYRYAKTTALESRAAAMYAAANWWSRAKANAQNLTSPESLDTLIYNFQDKMIDLKRLRDRIKALQGTITDLNDAYLGEELYHGRVAKRTEVFLAGELKPLLADLRSSGIGMAEFEQFLHARHAPEANADLAKRNPNLKEIDGGRQKAAAEVKALATQLQSAQAAGKATKAIEQALNQARGELAKWNMAQAFQGTEEERLSLSGMSDAEAAAVMAKIPAARRAHFDALAARVDAINEKTLKLLEQYGLMDKASVDAWRAAYQHYVPLHRDEAHPDSGHHPIGQGFSVKGDASKRRTGSNEKVTHILGHIAMQREAAITRGEKNNVTKKLYLMAAQNPDKDFWLVDKPPMIKTVDKGTGFVRSSIDPLYKNKPNVVMLRIAGKDAAVVFNEHNKEAVRLAGALKNLDAGDLHLVLGWAAKGTRWFASINTQYNPIFGLINLARDAQSGILNLGTTAIADKKAEVTRGILPAMRAVYGVERGGKPLFGAYRPDPAWAKLWEEFQEVGGQTGYRDLYANAEDRAEALLKELKSLDRWKITRAAHAVVDWLSDYNTAMENAVRLSAYKAALDKGISKERAASIAKNLTVNFNRKGAHAREIGALYAFFNASIQGTARMAETLAGPTGKKIIYGGILLGVMNAAAGMFLMGGGDDDEWEKIPEFIKERSLIIPLSREDFITIPLPLGFHVLPNIGRLAMEFAFGGKDKTAGRQIGKMLGLLSEAFNPIGSAGISLQTLAPTVVDPIAALAENRDWTGKPIYRENRNANDPVPGHARAKDSASTFSKEMAKAINAITGGNEYRPGAWSPTPDQIDYVIGQLTGGLGREIMKVEQTATSFVTGDELPPHKIPLAGRLYGNTRGASGNVDKFNENVRELNEIENEAKGRAKDRNGFREYLDSEPKIALVGPANAAENQVQKLRTYRRELVRRAEPGYKDEVKEIDARIGQVMKDLNRRVAEQERAGK